MAAETHGDDGSDKDGLRDGGMVVVVCATDQEASHVIALLDKQRETRILSWRLVVGTIGAVHVGVYVTWVGITHAAMATTALLLSAGAFSARPAEVDAARSAAAVAVPPVAALISCGCAGAHVRDMKQGDIVVCDTVIPLGAARIGRDGSRRQVGIRLGMKQDAGRGYDSTDWLVKAAHKAASAMELPPWPTVPGADGAEAAPHRPRVWLGPVASTDTFTQHAPTLEDIAAAAGTICEEMEAVSVAAAATEFGVPHVAVKDIANNELAVGDSGGAASWGGASTRSELGRRAALAVGATLCSADFLDRFLRPYSA